MDLLTYIPAADCNLLFKKEQGYFVIALLAILPDLDVFLGIHRGILHSLVSLIPVTLLTLLLGRLLRSEVRYAYTAIFFLLLSHIFLDFFAGGVPFLHPIVYIGVGEFPLKVSFGSNIVIEDFMPRLVFITSLSMESL